MPEVPEHLEDMWITLSGAMGAMAETQAITMTQLIKKMSAQGMGKDAIKQTLIRDLREGGQIFGDFRKQFKSNMKWGIEETARKEFEAGADKDTGMWEWLAIADNRLCPDCADRNAMSPMRWSEWESIGLPGGGSTICGANCRCRMIIAEKIDKPQGGILLKKDFSKQKKGK